MTLLFSTALLVQREIFSVELKRLLCQLDLEV